MSSPIQPPMVVEKSSPLKPPAVVDKSSRSNSKEKSKCNEIDKYVREEKAAQARFLASIIPSDVLRLTSSKSKDTETMSQEKPSKNKVVRNRLPAVSLDEQSLNSPDSMEPKDRPSPQAVSHGYSEHNAGTESPQSNDPVAYHIATTLSTTSQNIPESSGGTSGLNKTSSASGQCFSQAVHAGGAREGSSLPASTRLLEMLTPCTSTALLATGLEVAGCGGCGTISTTSVPSSPSPNILFSSSSTSSASSSSSPSRTCSTFFPSSPTCSNGSPPSLNLSAASSPRSSFSSTFSPLRMSNVSFSYSSPLSSTSSSGPKNTAGFPSIGTDKVAQLTGSLDSETLCDRPLKLATLDTASPNKSTSPKPASKVSPLRCNAPTESSTDGSFSKPSFQAPLSNGLTNCCDKPPPLLTPSSRNKRVMFVADMCNHKGTVADGPGSKQTPTQFTTGELSLNHKAAVEATMRGHKTFNNAMSQLSAVKASNKTEPEMYRQKETSL